MVKKTELFHPLSAPKHHPSYPSLQFLFHPENKREWHEFFDDLKAQINLDGIIKDGSRGSEKYKSPDKRFCLHLTEEAMQNTRAKDESNGPHFAGKAIMSFGLSMDVDGNLREILTNRRDVILKCNQ